MKLTTFSKSFIKFDNSSAFPTIEKGMCCYRAFPFCFLEVRSEKLIFYIWFQSFDDIFRKLLEEFKLVEALQLAVQPAVVGYCTCLIEVDVWVSFQLIKGQFINLQLFRCRILDYEVAQ